MISTVHDASSPGFGVTVNGSPLPLPSSLQVNRIRVDQEVGWPGMFALELAGGDDANETAWIDGTILPIGGALEIRMGYGNTLVTLIAGEITGLEPVFARSSRPRLTVRGYDRRHRLLRGRKTRSFLQQKDSDIATAIASEAGLTAQTTDSQVTHAYVLQANQTNMAFLQERARRIQYEVAVEDRVLYFRPVQNAESEVLTLTPDDDLLEFHPRLSTMGQPTELEVRAWSPTDKAELVARAQVGDEVSTMGGSDIGASSSQTAFGAAQELVCDEPVLTQAELDQLARSGFNRTLLEFIRGDGVCHGRPDLRPGTVIKLDGIGTRFGGQYYVSSASHRYTPNRAFQTHFAVFRNAS